MTNEQRKLLEEIEQVDGHALTPVGKRIYMAGAQAAWSMATNTERERCWIAITDNMKFFEIAPSALFDSVEHDILRPAPRINGTAEEASQAYFRKVGNQPHSASECDDPTCNHY